MPVSLSSKACFSGNGLLCQAENLVKFKFLYYLFSKGNIIDLELIIYWGVTSMAKIALITGASSGIGYAAALESKERSFSVYGAARRVEKMNGLLERGIKTIPLDVTNDVSMCKW